MFYDKDNDIVVVKWGQVAQGRHGRFASGVSYGIDFMKNIIFGIGVVVGYPLRGGK